VDKKFGDVGYYDSPELAAARRELKERALEHERITREKISKMKIKQLLPIPEKYTVLVYGEEEVGKYGYLDLEREGWTFPFFVLAEDAGKSIIGVYAIGNFGDGDIETDFRLTLRQPAG